MHDVTVYLHNQFVEHPDEPEGEYFGECMTKRGEKKKTNNIPVESSRSDFYNIRLLVR